MAILTSAVAPTNTLLGNPAAVKRAYETGGFSLLRGTRNFVKDLRSNRGMPSTVNRGAFTVGMTSQRRPAPSSIGTTSARCCSMRPRPPRCGAGPC